MSKFTKKITHNREELSRLIESEKKEFYSLGLGAAEEMEKWRIQQNPAVRKYYAAIFSSLSEAFIFADGTTKTEFTEIGFFRITADFFKQVPFAAAAALARTGISTKTELLDQVRNISDFSASGEIFNPTIFLEKLARRMAVSNQDEIAAANNGERKDQLKQIRSFFKQVEENSGRNFFHVEWLAMQDAEAVVRYLKTQNQSEILDTKSKIETGDYESLVRRVTSKVLEKYSDLAVSEASEVEEDVRSQSAYEQEDSDDDSRATIDIDETLSWWADVDIVAPQPSPSSASIEQKFSESVQKDEEKEVKDDRFSAKPLNEKRSSRRIIS